MPEVVFVSTLEPKDGRRDELVELTGLPAERSQDLIMKARAHWFENTEHAE